ncbi:MAG: alpha/beta fold hydrolase [Planctomycetota bacterium]
METRFIAFENTRLAVHLAGHGPLAMLLHGYPLDHRMWLDVMHGPLAEQRTLAAIDLRGHGQSPWCGDTVHTMELLADDVSTVIHTLTDDAIDIVGLSMGGYVAQALWQHHGGLVRSLALVDTRSRSDDDAGKASRNSAAQTVVAQGRGALAAGMLPKLLASRPASDAHGLMLRARLQTMMEAQSIETIVADLRGLRDRPDRTDMLPSIAVPTLVVVGSEDAITPRAESEQMAKSIPGAKLAVVAGCGHMTPMEDPATFARELGAFWRALG